MKKKKNMMSDEALKKNDTLDPIDELVEKTLVFNQQTVATLVDKILRAHNLALNPQIVVSLISTEKKQDEQPTETA